MTTLSSSPRRDAPRSGQPRVKRERHALHGWINLDKPYDMTSTQAVGAIKRLFSPEKIGHAGTLDPLATGVLPLALGEATKTVQFMMDARKIYRFTVCFGEQRTTDDMEGEVMACSDIRPDDSAIRAALPAFTGEIEQLPPTFSALKIDGQRAYDLARAGQEVTLTPRPVYIERFELLERPDADHAIFEVECGKGTYVRSLARDLSARLSTCGHISALRRTRVGGFVDSAAISLDELEEYAIQGGLSSKGEWLEPIERALDDIPAVMLDLAQIRRLRHGQPCIVSPAAFATDAGYVSQNGQELYRAVQGSGVLGLVTRKGRGVSPVRMFHHPT